MKRSIGVFLCVFCLGCGDRPFQLKVATYNIYFLDAGISEARKARLQKVIEQLDADIIGFQEIASEAGLKHILPEEYEVGMLDDPGDFQELAVAVRKPFQIRGLKAVFPAKEYERAFPYRRDLLEVEVAGYGRQFVILIHHAKSRSGGRVKTDPRRAAASQMIVEHVRNGLKDRYVILMGDFNDNPDDRSVNILESGDPEAKGGMDGEGDPFLYNVTEALLEQNYCSYGYTYLYGKAKGETFELSVEGARQENSKWRGKEHDFMRDVKVKAILFDQILVSTNLKAQIAGKGVFNKTTAVTGKRSRVRFRGRKPVYSQRGDFASDHVPVWAVLKF